MAKPKKKETTAEKHARWREQLATKGHGPTPPDQELWSEDPALYKIHPLGRGSIL